MADLPTVRYKVTYDNPTYTSNYFIAGVDCDVLNTGWYYPKTNEQIYLTYTEPTTSTHVTISPGLSREWHVDMGYGFDTESIYAELSVPYSWADNATTKNIKVSKITSVYYPWVITNPIDRYFYQPEQSSSGTQHTITEIQRGSVPTVLQRHLADFTPVGIWEAAEYNRLKQLAFGLTLTGSETKNTTGSIGTNSTDKTLEISYNNQTYTYTSDYFIDKVIPKRLIVAIQAAGGSGGGQGGSGGGSGAFWLGVINIDDYNLWNFTLGAPGQAVSENDDGKDASETILHCPSTQSSPRKIVIGGGFGGKVGQGDAVSAGGAGGVKARYPSSSLEKTDYWVISDTAGFSGGASGYYYNRSRAEEASSGYSVSAQTIGLSQNDTANNYPRNQFKISNNAGGEAGVRIIDDYGVSIAGGGAASYSGSGGKGGYYSSTAYAGSAGGVGAGGGGAGKSSVTSGAGGIATISFYY